MTDQPLSSAYLDKVSPMGSALSEEERAEYRRLRLLEGSYDPLQEQADWAALMEERRKNPPSYIPRWEGRQGKWV